MNSQFKKRKIKNITPPINNKGADCSTDSLMVSSAEKDAINDSIGPRVGFAIQKISHGNKPLIKKTAINKPQTKNQRLAFKETFDKTSALMTALSMLLTASKTTKPRIVNAKNKSSITSYLEEINI